MKKINILILVVCLILSLNATAQELEHSLSIGGRFGGNAYTTYDDIDSKFGAQGFFDLNYTCYFIKSKNLSFGPKIGFSFGYSASGMTMKYKDKFVNHDYEGREIDYTITGANIEENFKQWQIEIPVMAALRYNGLLFCLGVKCMAPLSWEINQTIQGAKIDAYYPDYDVHVVDELITGKFSSANQSSKLDPKSTINFPKINLMMSLEFGYEWKLGKYTKNTIGIMGYIDYSGFNSFKRLVKDGEGNKDRILQITDIVESYDEPYARVIPNFMHERYANSMSMFDVGVKLQFSFGFEGYAGGYYKYTNYHRGKRR
ncbi:MAG: hypothetical protein MJZ93_01845 [Paludibacteraceae bacterium]|nr:hypothetical protein [Paludibacteraceae bacterium]